MPITKPMVNVATAVEGRVENARDGAEAGTDEEDEGDRRIRVDPDQRRGLRVFRDRADADAEIGAIHEEFERHHQRTATVKIVSCL